MTFLLKTSYMKITSNIKKLRPLFSLYKKNDDIYQWTFVKSQIYAHCFIRRVREKIITSKKFQALVDLLRNGTQTKGINMMLQLFLTYLSTLQIKVGPLDMALCHLCFNC